MKKNTLSLIISISSAVLSAIGFAFVFKKLHYLIEKNEVEDDECVSDIDKLEDIVDDLSEKIEELNCYCNNVLYEDADPIHHFGDNE